MEKPNSTPTPTTAPKEDDINPNTYQYPNYPRPKRKYIKKKDQLKGIQVSYVPVGVKFE